MIQVRLHTANARGRLLFSDVNAIIRQALDRSAAYENVRNVLQSLRADQVAARLM